MAKLQSEWTERETKLLEEVRESVSEREKVLNELSEAKESHTAEIASLHNTLTAAEASAEAQATVSSQLREEVDSLHRMFLSLSIFV